LKQEAKDDRDKGANLKRDDQSGDDRDQVDYARPRPDRIKHTLELGGGSKEKTGGCDTKNTSSAKVAGKHLYVSNRHPRSSADIADPSGDNASNESNHSRLVRTRDRIIKFLLK
jgi:hypothetical protein